MTTAKRVLLVLALASILTLAGAGLALALPGGAGNAIPHGGYSPLTDACLQCHDVHEAKGDYVLLRWKTVTDTCGSCHYLYQTVPGGLGANPKNPYMGGYADKSPASIRGSYDTTAISPAYNPGFGSTDTPYNPQSGGADNDDPRGPDGLPFTADDLEESSLYGTSISAAPSIGSQWSAYEVTTANRADAPGHQLQRGGTEGTAEWLFEDGNYGDANYIPGSDSLLTAIKKTDYPSTVSAMTYIATNGLNCASCHTPHGNYGQELLAGDGTATKIKSGRAKILSGRPNHKLDPRWNPNAPAGPSNPQLTVDSWTTQGGRWCAQCHNRRLESPLYKNHPDSACLICHGNAVGAGADTASDGGDFPHTGKNANILSQRPDALCITCHTARSLP